ncbi:lycopene beta-cyclase [Lewinella aquimaris]|uniref:Lycopene beta-cyclase n=1 Tax=Neolewinella aquimaris TaxID=1835722 RepID=A0A840E6A0_9BACT|nr:lycopene cyclase family protein [Neolewinella aquimaris]MBB4079145.1 lycopene beta-cyclase [Neolewinella aquimaris]
MTDTDTDYDIVVAGGGLAGLSMLYHLHTAGKLGEKRVLLVDPERKEGHDRTWSFWEKGEGPFEKLVHHRWHQVTLHNGNTHCSCALRPYAYKVILSNDFYGYVNRILDKLPNLERRFTTADQFLPTDDKVHFRMQGEGYSATHLFSSLPHPLDYREVNQPYLDQHFRGWFVETDEDTFDPGTAAMMDFRTPQEGETRFFYVLPFSQRRALVEIAIFSNDHLTTEAYDVLIGEYIRANWTRGTYRVTHTEAGNIPMTTYGYPRRRGNHIYIGLGGGAARPSTGYTFYGLQRQLARMARDYPDITDTRVWPEKHLLYDATLLRILQERKLAGEELFVNLFRDNPPARVLAFLNGESSLWQELRLMATTPVGVFGSTFVRELL